MVIIWGFEMNRQAPEYSLVINQVLKQWQKSQVGRVDCIQRQVLRKSIEEIFGGIGKPFCNIYLHWPQKQLWALLKRYILVPLAYLYTLYTLPYKKILKLTKKTGLKRSRIKENFMKLGCFSHFQNMKTSQTSMSYGPIHVRKSDLLPLVGASKSQ